MKTEVGSKRNGSYRNTMIELVIVIGMFSIIGILLVRVFLETNRLQKKAVDLGYAVIQTQNVAEHIKNNASLGETADELGMIPYDNTSLNYCIYYDEEWNQTESPSSNILLIKGQITKKEHGRMVSAVVSAYTCKEVQDTKGASAIVELTAKKWVTGR